MQLEFGFLGGVVLDEAPVLYVVEKLHNCRMLCVLALLKQHC